MTDEQRTKRNEASRRWRANNREQARACVRSHYERNRAQELKRRREYDIAHPEQTRARGRRADEKRKDFKREYNRQYVAARRREAIAGYGGKCACCGETEARFLTFDHINNDGAAHRKEISTGARLYIWLKTQGFPRDRFRLLCFNCNCGRAMNGGICPHQVVML